MNPERSVSLWLVQAQAMPMNHAPARIRMNFVALFRNDGRLWAVRGMGLLSFRERIDQTVMLSMNVRVEMPMTGSSGV